MIDGNTTMTTDPTVPDRREERARKVARARALTDPLGAKGQRRSSQRVEREAAARRVVFVATLGAFVASFGLAAASDSGRVGAPSESVQPAGALFEFVVPAPLGSGEPSILVRVQAPQPHVRTRATP